MFEMRVTESFSAPPELLEQFLVETKLAEEQDGCMLLLVRGRQHGQMSIVKFSIAADADADPASSQSLSNEAQILKELNHRHICALIEGPDSVQLPYLAFTFWGQLPLKDDDWSGWPEPDRVRIIIQLVDAVSYLQSLDQPVSHGAITANQLWYAPATRWIQLAGFGQAQRGAGAAELKQDRQAVMDLAEALLPETEEEQNWQSDLADWVAKGNAVVDELKTVLQRHLFSVVTTDL